ncbi:MAG: serine/threonine-protein kinase [Planctomycetota bacterium]
MDENQRIMEAFHLVLELASHEQRERYLEELSQKSTELAAKVRKLIAAHEKAASFLEEPPTWSAVSCEHETRPPASTRTSELTRFQNLPCDFGNYELLAKIAHGGMGVVFRARHKALNRIVAIKMILSGELAGKAEVERFRVEAEAAGKLDHRGIVPVYDIGFVDGQHYFSMAYVSGESLSEKISNNRPGPREAASLVAKISDAIQFAHDHGIVHRDLKPGNVLIDENGEPRVTDFGLAKRIEADSNLTLTGIILGTPGYMPPEQASGKEIDASADVYSLGAILYAMLTGKPPFESVSPMETLLQVIREEPVPPRTIDRQIPTDLEIICLKCLEKESAARYYSASELSHDLRRYLSGHPISARSDFLRRTRRWAIGEPGLATHLLATVAMITIIFVNWMLLGSTKEDFDVLLKNSGILSSWAILSFVFQKIQNRLKTRKAIPYAWSITNQFMLTVVLAMNSPPRGSLTSLYVLMLISSSFFRRMDIVLVTTAASLAGYCILVCLFFVDSELSHRSYLVLQAVNIAVSGLLLGVLARRLEKSSDETLK